MSEMMTEEELQQTDVQVVEGMDKKFNTLARMVHGVAMGALTALTVQGDKGLGKSHIVHNVLDTYDPSIPGGDLLPEERRRSIKRITGKVTPLQLFTTLQDYANKKSIVLFDDCDSVWNEPDALNILKAATDTKPRRIVTWASSSNSRVGRDQSYLFEGSVIVVTNANPDNVHFRAFASRANKYRLRLSLREKLLKIAQITYYAQEYDRQMAMEVCQFIYDHAHLLGDRLDLRTFVHCYRLRTFDPDWQQLAIDTVFSEAETDYHD